MPRARETAFGASTPARNRVRRSPSRWLVARCLSCATLALLAWAAVSRAQAPSRGVRLKVNTGAEMELYSGSHALLIGVSRYTAGWPSLESVPSELGKVATALQAQGFTVDRVDSPTGDALRRAFEDFINRYGFSSGERLLIFFSGHGYTRKDGKKGYIVPADAPDPNRDEVGFLTRAVEMDQVNAWARRIEAKHVLFLFDSCFSGTIFKAKELPIPRAISFVTTNPVRQFISAGSAGEPVPAQSVFTPSLVRGIEGEADLDHDGYVTGTELGLYVRDKVASYETGQTPQFGKIKDPDLDEGDFVFAVPRRPTGAAAAAAPPVTELDFGDLEAQAKAEREWATYLESMRNDLDKVQGLERDARISADVKAEAWRRFAGGYGADHPFSTEDDSMRQQAAERARYWGSVRPTPLSTLAPTEPAAPVQVADNRAAASDASGVGPAGGSVIGQVRVNPKDGLEYVGIPPGEFEMGCVPGDSGCYGDEKPRHYVRITKGFWLGRTEVTVRAYQRYVNATGTNMPPPPSFPQRDDHPVVNVSWDEAVAYCTWSGGRLPAEAEWEFAARAGRDGLKYPWGDSISHDDANFDGAGGRDQWANTSPVGSFSANSFQLYDVAGNVWEWCADRYDPKYYASSPGADPKGPSSGSIRALRGGSWLFNPWMLRASYRISLEAARRTDNLGFRCSRDGAP
jgi:formylglycine-generating enzyme required for sulfatase activity